MRRYAIAGPVNVGKSSLFYALTGFYVKTANYPGTTVEIHKAYLRRDGEKIEIVDLPGVLNPENPRDEDEKIAMKEIAEGSYDGVVVVVAPHAVGNALKIAEVAGRYKPVAVVFNMADLWTPPYSEEELSKALGVPVVYVSATKRSGVEKLVKLLVEGLPRGTLRPIKLEPPATAAFKSSVLARPVLALLTLVALGFAAALFLMAVVEGITPWGAQLPVSIVQLLDAVDGAVSSWILENLGGLAGRFVAEALWGTLLTLLTISVYVFVALSLITLYEDSGVIALLSRSLERQLTRLGIPPRGVVCLFVAASCNVPAVATARVLWGRSNRVLTALLLPYVPCVARLAIFAAVATAAFAHMPYLIPLAVFLPYVVAFLVVLLASFIYRRLLGLGAAAGGEVPPSLILLPNLRIYALKVAAEFREFFHKVAPPLVAVMLALWPLQAFGPHGVAKDVSHSYLALAGQAMQPLFGPLGMPWELVMPLIGGWIFKEVVLGLLEATGGLQLLPSLPLPAVFAYLVFTAMYSACIATLSSIYKTVGLRLTLLSVAANLLLAYVAAYLTYFTLSLVF
ncbi:small GTP-binding protein domain [Pyrobaculum sp. WP30]|nr:small GTP-binding protein domain [Pyrobaculum sp. WP30]